VGAIEDVTATDARAKIATLLLDPFDKAEQRASNEFSEWTHPVKRADRRKIPIEIEALYRATMEEEGWSAYFVEAVKKYAPAPEDRGCGLVTSANGWVLVGPSKELVRIAGRITYCDRKGVSFFLPLGLIRANGHLYWVSQSSGYDHEFYNVTRPTSKDIRYEVSYPVAVCGR
jgi:DNA-binding cell septation regulator SpoVG